MAQPFQRGSPGRVRISVHDSSPMGTQLLCDALRRDRRLAPVPAFSLESIVADDVDLALVALNAECISFRGPALIQEIRRRRPDIPVVVLIEESSRSAVVDAFRAGARGVLCRTESIKALGKCINCVANGEVWANHNEIDYLLRSLADPIPIRLVDAKGTALLSAREQDVVRWVAEGLTNREIAERLGLSEHTIKNYLFRIFDKLGISNRMELILYVVSQLAPRPVGNEGLAYSGRNGLERKRDPEWCTSLPAYDLGQSYKAGEGVPVDPVTAYMWFDIAESAASQTAEKAASAITELKQSMTHEQVAEAKRRSADWLNPQNRPARTRERRIRRGLRGERAA
jgi:two-component system, NarL family, nitrate/nitrite response regulator NarL